MHHPTSSAPTFEHGAPPIPTPSSRGRCAICTRPIYDGQAAVHVSTSGFRYPSELPTKPVPYQHKECPK